MQIPERLKVRIAMDKAAAEGEWDRHAALQAQWQDLITGAASDRRDALDALEARLDAVTAEAPAEEPAAESDEEPIDWGNVASEVKLMLELNGQGATASEDSQR